MPKLSTQLERLGGGAALLRIIGEVDMATVDILGDRFRALVDQGINDVIVDATEVTFMDSTGLHALVAGKQIIHDKGTRIFLVPSAPVRRLFDLVFPEPLFAARMDSVEEAIAAIDDRYEDR